MGSGFSWSKILGQQIPSPLKKNATEETVKDEVVEQDSTPVDNGEQDSQASKKWKGFSFEVEANEDSFSMAKVPTVGSVDSESNLVEPSPSVGKDTDTVPSSAPEEVVAESAPIVAEFQGLSSMAQKASGESEADPLERIRELQRKALEESAHEEGSGAPPVSPLSFQPEDLPEVQTVDLNLEVPEGPNASAVSSLEEAIAPPPVVEQNIMPPLPSEEAEEEVPVGVNPNPTDDVPASRVYDLIAPPEVNTWIPGQDNAHLEFEGPELEAAIESMPEPELVDDQEVSAENSPLEQSADPAVVDSDSEPVPPESPFGEGEADPVIAAEPAVSEVTDTQEVEAHAIELKREELAAPPIIEPDNAESEAEAPASLENVIGAELVEPANTVETQDSDPIERKADPEFELVSPSSDLAESPSDGESEAELSNDHIEPSEEATLSFEAMPSDVENGLEPATDCDSISLEATDTLEGHSLEGSNQDFEVPVATAQGSEPIECEVEGPELHGVESTESEAEPTVESNDASDEPVVESSDASDEPLIVNCADTTSEADVLVPEATDSENLVTDSEEVAASSEASQDADEVVSFDGSDEGTAMSVQAENPEVDDSSEPLMVSESESDPETASVAELSDEVVPIEEALAPDLTIEDNGEVAESAAADHVGSTDMDVPEVASVVETDSCDADEVAHAECTAATASELENGETVLMAMSDTEELSNDDPSEATKSLDEVSDLEISTPEFEANSQSSEAEAEEEPASASAIPDVFAKAMQNAVPEALPISQAPTKLRASGSPDFGNTFAALDPRTGMPMSFDEINLNIPMSFDEEDAAANTNASSDAKGQYKPGYVPASVHSIDVSDHRFDEPVEDDHDNVYTEPGDATKISDCHIDDILRFAIEHKASDCHFTAGLPPMMRLDGEIVPMPFTALTTDETKKLIFETLTDEQLEKFETTHELDFAYTVRGLSRFRFNAYMQRGAVAGALRAIPTKIPSFETLGLPPVIRELSKRTSGLILVTGPTGSGKSTTIASMIDDINETRTSHIVTIEDPIEYLHRHKKCMVNQRELHSDTYSLHNALRAVLREDPDIILVGELRDLETIEAALTLAETGHLVFGTLHTRNAPASVDRIVDVFPSDQQSQIRVLLGNTLEGIVSQQLLPKLGGGRCAALEIMVATPAIKNLVREGKTHQMYSSIETGGQLGMQTMDSSLANFIRLGYCSYDECLMRAVDKETFARLAKSAA